jgi:hypothetical protein
MILETQNFNRMKERINESDSSSMSYKKSNMSYEYPPESYDKSQAMDTSSRKPFDQTEYSEQFISSEQVKKHQTQNRRNVFRESIITNPSMGDLDEPMQNKMIMNIKKMSFKDSCVDNELTKEKRTNSSLMTDSKRQEEDLKNVSSSESELSNPPQFQEKIKDQPKPFQKSVSKLRAFSFSHGHNDHKKSFVDEKAKESPNEVIVESSIPIESPKPEKSGEYSTDRVPEIGSNKKLNLKDKILKTYSQQNDTPNQKNNLVHNTNIMKFSSNHPISSFNPLTSKNPLDKINTDSPKKHPSDSIFKIKPLVICSDCNHVQTLDFGRVTHKLSPFKSGNYWNSLTKNSSPFASGKAGDFRQEDNLEDFSKVHNGSCISEKKEISKKKMSKLNKNLSEMYLDKKIEELKNSSVQSQSEESPSKRKMTKSSIEINLNYNTSLGQKEIPENQSYMSRMLKPPSQKTPEKKSRSIIQQIILQLSNPNKEFSENLIRIHNKFMVQSGRSICVSVCEGCDSLFKDDPATSFEDSYSKDKYFLEGPNNKFLNLTERASDFSENEFNCRKRSSMDAKVYPDPKNIQSLTSNSRFGGSLLTRNSLRENLRRFRSNTLNSKEEKYVPFCFCTFCQFNLMKSIKEMETSAVGEEPEVKLRVNKLKIEYKKMELARSQKRLTSRISSEKNNLTLSEKIMKGVIDNLLLKSLNDSRDEVRIQTLNSLNLISPDFIYFLVSSNYYYYINQKTTIFRNSCYV